MSGSGTAAAGAAILWIIIMTVASLLFVFGGIYVLYCLSRAAAGIDRLASAVESWVALQHRIQAASWPGGVPPRETTVARPTQPGVTPAAPAPQPFTPGASSQPIAPSQSIAPPASNQSDSL